MMKNSHINNFYKSEAETIEASVKWYNPRKEYGFLILDDNSEDIFIHYSVFAHYGVTLEKGDRVLCMVEDGKVGRKVNHVLDIIFFPKNDKNKNNVFPEKSEKIKGKVKWFNLFKGYGFVTRDDGGDDVFLYATVLHKIGYKDIKPGTHVLFKVRSAEGKDEIINLEVIE